MTHRYVWSGATGANNGTSWADAFTSISAAIAAGAAGDNFWIAHDHDQSFGASTVLTLPSTTTLISTAVCVNRAGSVPPVEADLRETALIYTSGTFSISVSGRGYWYGIDFRSGVGSSSATTITMASSTLAFLIMERCKIRKKSTTQTSSAITFGNTGATPKKLYLINCLVEFGRDSDQVQLTVIGDFLWENDYDFGPAFLSGEGAVGQGNLIGNGNRSFGRYVFDGLDLSNFVSLSNMTTGNDDTATISFRRSKLPTTVNNLINNLAGSMQSVLLNRSHTAQTVQRNEKQMATGRLTLESTIIRSGGAHDGLTGYGWKIVTTTSARRYVPFECPRITIWNDVSLVDRTLTIYGIWGDGAVPTNADIWAEIRYPAESDSTLSAIVENYPSFPLDSGTNHETDDSTWGGSTTAFKIVNVLNNPQPQLRGPIEVILKMAKPSSTFYIDPKVIIS